jgi:hypothetical protein
VEADLVRRAAGAKPDKIDKARRITTIFNQLSLISNNTSDAFAIP